MLGLHATAVTMPAADPPLKHAAADPLSAAALSAGGAGRRRPRIRRLPRCARTLARAGRTGTRAAAHEPIHKKGRRADRRRRPRQIGRPGKTRPNEQHAIETFRHSPLRNSNTPRCQTDSRLCAGARFARQLESGYSGNRQMLIVRMQPARPAAGSARTARRSRRRLSIGETPKHCGTYVASAAFR